MKDYSKGIIYIIECNETGEIYVGSTVATLDRRMTKHRYDAINTQSTSATQIIQRGNYEAICIEEYPCENQTELRKREEWHRVRIETAINKYKCYVSPEEAREYKKNYMSKWKKDNDDHVREYNKAYLKEYRENRTEEQKEEIKEYQRNWFQQNKEVIYERIKKRKEHDPEYKEQQQEYQKQWAKNKRDTDTEHRQREAEKALARYHTNKEAINKRRMEELECEQCGEKVKR